MSTRPERGQGDSFAHWQGAAAALVLGIMAICMWYFGLKQLSPSAAMGLLGAVCAGFALIAGLTGLLPLRWAALVFVVFVALSVAAFRMPPYKDCAFGDITECAGGEVSYGAGSGPVL